jgi:ribonucleoside-diphosphate reductase beta chain
MNENDAVELVERASLESLKDLDTDLLYLHADFLARSVPGPLDLYVRWQRQQWSPSALDFSIDRRQWAVLAPSVQRQLARTLRGFSMGEGPLADTLEPLLIGAPATLDRLFLATQVVDEARHALFFTTFFRDVLGDNGDDEDDSGDSTPVGTECYDRIFDPKTGEVARAVKAVRADPYDYGAWVQAVTLYHLVVEGLLALTGQHFVLRVLRVNDLLPGFRAGLTAVTRDESRHVSFGIWSLQRAVAAGRQADVSAVIDRTLEPSIRAYANPRVRLARPLDLPPDSRVDPRDNWSFVVSSITQWLRTIGLGADYVAAVHWRAWSHIWASVALYEQLHGEDHPVRAWERGEVKALLPLG